MSQTNDELFRQLGILGYTGTLADRIMAFGSITSGNVITESYVKHNAGITRGVVPGVLTRAGTNVAGTLETDFGFIPQNMAGMTDISGASMTTITCTGPSTWSGSAVTRSGTGTSTSDPITIQSYLLYQPSTPQGIFVWNDSTSTTPYHIKFKNILFGPYPNGNFNTLLITAAPAGSSITFENCNIGMSSGVTGSAYAHIRCNAAGVTVNVTRSLITAVAGYAILKGANCTINVTDSMFSSTLSTWGGAFSGGAIFRNIATGGALNISRCTFDHRGASTFLWMSNDCTVTIDRINFNSSDNTSVQGFIPTGSGSLSEAWTSGLTLTNSRISTGNTSSHGSMIGNTNFATGVSCQNFLIENCEFIATGTFFAGNRFAAMGNSANSDTEHTKNIRWRWCRFTRPQTGATHIVAGCEVLEHCRCSDVTIEYCWTVSCGEDAYEFYEPYRNNVVRYSGGGDVTGSYVGGQIVDVFGNFANWTSGTVEVHHIWGACRGDAVIVDSVANTVVHDISVDNVIGGFAQNLPVGNVRLHSRAANGLNGVRVTLPLSAPRLSYSRTSTPKPVCVTCETALHDVGTVQYVAWNPVTMVYDQINTGTSTATYGGREQINA